MSFQLTQGTKPHGIQATSIGSAILGAGTTDLGTVGIGKVWRIFALQVSLSVANDGNSAYAQFLINGSSLLSVLCADTTTGQVNSNGASIVLSGDDAIFLTAGQKVQGQVSAGRGAFSFLYQEVPA